MYAIANSAHAGYFRAVAASRQSFGNTAYWTKIEWDVKTWKTQKSAEAAMRKELESDPTANLKVVKIK